MGYRRTYTAQRHWWMQNYTGLYVDGFNDVTDVIGKWIGVNSPLTIPQIQSQTIQYHAVWLFAGHGGGGNTMALWNTATGIANNRADIGPDDPSWSYFTSTNAALAGLPGNLKMSLESLPLTYSGGGSSGKGSVPFGPRLNQLRYAKLVSFMGCATAPDLPRQAVNMGAQSAIGFNVSVDQQQLLNFTNRFFSELKGGANVWDAARTAELRSTGEATCDVRRAGNTYPTLTSPSWGDGLGPEQK